MAPCARQIYADLLAMPCAMSLLLGSVDGMILLYGDSLTAGFSDGGNELNPYGTTLEAIVGVPVGIVGASGQSAKQLLVVKDSSVVVR